MKLLRRHKHKHDWSSGQWFYISDDVIPEFSAMCECGASIYRQVLLGSYCDVAHRETILHNQSKGSRD